MIKNILAVISAVIVNMGLIILGSNLTPMDENF